MATQRYNLSFTAGGLLYSESVRIAEAYAKTNDWKEVAKYAVENRLLQSRTINTEKRKVREISSRLRLLTDAQLKILLSGTHADQLQVLWLAACKRYRFLHDFAEKVLRTKFLEMDLAITVTDVDRYELSPTAPIGSGARYLGRATSVFALHPLQVLLAVPSKRSHGDQVAT